jgi:ATP-dependent helicase HrpB
LQETRGSVLCFQPGAVEIGRTIDALQSAGLPSDVEILPLHGTLSSAQQDIALTSSPGSRRVIVCTNIAETSITVPGVTGVVDSGLEKVARYDAERAIDSLTTERISEAAADQRAGRAGRTGPGVVYRLWSASDRLRPFREPEIDRVDMSGLVLDVAGWGGDPRTLEWFEPPRAEALAAAIALLNRMNALHGVTLTEIGRSMLRVPLHPRLARIVVASNGDLQAIRAAAVLSERIPFEPRRAATSSDLLSILDRWSEVPQHVHALVRQIDGRAGAPGGLRQSVETDRDLRLAIFSGYPDRVAQRREPHSPRFLMSTGTGAVQSEQSGVKDAEFIVALDLHAPAKDESQNRISIASAVERSWLTPTSIEVKHELDARGAVRAREVERYDALTLADRAVSPDPERAVELLSAEWLAHPLPDDVRQLLSRIGFASCTIDLPQLVRAAAYGAARLDDIDLRRVLPSSVVRALERNAPESLLLPSGRHVRLDYAADGQVSASVKLQELFGLAETPRIGPRREPVLLALLAPNGRPVQLTRDLRSFWDRTYPEVRKELRGRYPRHPWPEDPWKAQPTHRTNRRP